MIDGFVKVKQSTHLDFPRNNASNIGFAGGYGKRSLVSRIGGPSNQRNNLANEDIVKLESPRQQDGA